MRPWLPIVAILCAGGIGASLSPSPALAAPPSFQLPLACDLPQRCFVEFYVDHGPGPDVADYRCGGRSYDTHRGTDFRVRDPADFAAGVPVLAAAAGTVLATRDDMADIDVTVLGRGKVAGMAGGNAVVVLHDDGWVSQYWHMRRGSVLVRKGDRVAAGQRLGTIGLSGDTNFPHLHFEVSDPVRQVVDPFSGAASSRSCGDGGQTMWTPQALQALAYQPIEAVGGFAARRPARPSAPYVEADRRVRPGGPLHFWFELAGVRQNDVYSVRFVLSDGSPRRPSTATVTATNGYIFRDAELDRSVRLRPGRYAALLSVARDGKTILERRFETEVK